MKKLILLLLLISMAGFAGCVWGEILSAEYWKNDFPRDVPYYEGTEENEASGRYKWHGDQRCWSRSDLRCFRR